MNIAQATISGTRTDHDAFVCPGSPAFEIAAEPLDHGAPNTDLTSGEQIFSVVAHIAKIGRIGFRQKRHACIPALLAALLPALGLLAACSGPAVVESSDMAVTVRYGAMDGIDEASELAQRACAAHHKTARLRNTANFGVTDRYAHFDCV